MGREARVVKVRTFDRQGNEVEVWGNAQDVVKAQHISLIEERSGIILTDAPHPGEV